jgi:hypothetical protein
MGYCRPVTHRGRRSEYGMEKYLARRMAFKDPKSGDVVARNVDFMRFFQTGEILVSPRQDGSLQRERELNRG